MNHIIGFLLKILGYERMYNKGYTDGTRDLETLVREKLNIKDSNETV